MYSEGLRSVTFLRPRPRSTRASQGFSLEQLLVKEANPHPKQGTLFSLGKMSGAVHR